MQKKRILAALISAAMVVTLAAVPVFADELDEAAPEAVETVEAELDDAIELAEDPVWTSGGTGEEDEPYNIKSEDDLKALADFDDTTGKFFKLTNDIELTAPWTTKIDFKGTLDGAKDENTNYEITGISINDTASANRALFSTNSGTIKNITIRGSITARRAAGLVYENKNGGKIENCVNHCEVRATNKYEAYASGVNEGAGGIVEKNSGGSISKCFNYGNIFTNIDGGGIAALNNGKITESENYGSISPIEPDCKYLTLGGIAGRNGGGQFPSGTITNCKNYGDIEATSTNGYPGITIGGIAGNFVETSTIEGCLNAGSLTTTDSSSDTGGIVGHMTDNGKKITLTNNANAGKVTAAEDTYYGAIIGCAPIPEDWTKDGSNITIKNNTYLSNTSDLPYHYRPRSTFDVEAPTKEMLEAEEGNMKPVSFDDMDKEVKFAEAEKVEVKLTGGAGGVYDIVLNGVDGTKINRFMSAELNFQFESSDSIGFEVVPNEDLHINMIRPEKTEDGVSGVYEFNLDGSKRETAGEEAEYNADITNISITLGKIVITGHGKGTITVEGPGSIVNTAEAEDNIVDHYTAEGTADPTLILPTEVPVEVSLEMGDLWVYVLFPNNVGITNNIGITTPYDYNKMNVKIDSKVFGGESISVDLGYYEEGWNKYYGTMDIPETLSDAGLAKLGRNPSNTKNQSIPGSTEGHPGYYFSVKVPANFSYTLTFSGEGYRTYTIDTIVYPGSSSTNTETRVFVWNNAMDKPDTPVVVDHNGEHIFKTATDGTTFLAGDIVEDRDINLYDLSAVVAYFGKDGLYEDDLEEHKYVKYDLNRDGQVDSKDIAMVLVSWGK